MYKQLKAGIIRREIVTVAGFLMVSIIVSAIVWFLNKIYLFEVSQNLNILNYLPMVIFGQVVCYICESVFNYLLVKRDYYKINKLRIYPITFFPLERSAILNFRIYDKLFYSNIYLKNELKMENFDKALININDGLNKIIVNLMISGLSWLLYIILGYQSLLCIFVYSLIRGISRLLKFAKNGEFKYINDEYNLRAIHILISAILNMNNKEERENSLKVVLNEVNKIKLDNLNLDDKVYVIALKCYIFSNGIIGKLTKKEYDIVSRGLESFNDRDRFIKLLPITQYLINNNLKIADINDIYDSIKRECNKSMKSSKLIALVYIGMLLNKKDNEIEMCNEYVKELFAASNEYYKVLNLHI